MTDPDVLKRPADSVIARRYDVPGLAGLPDHSLSVWDWANANERCPSATGAAVTEVVKCHKLFFHLGALNSTHFLPQSKATYAWYHEIALDRARQCKALDGALKNSSLSQLSEQYTSEFVNECRREAMILEVFGQHFLQDAWSMGHMWQRWGAANLAEFPTTARFQVLNTLYLEIPVDRLTLAQVVAMTAGMIHGAEAMKRSVFEKDRMGGGAKYVELPSGAVSDGVGDYRADALGNPQKRRFMSCSVAGLRSVYKESIEGPIADPSGGLEEITPEQLLGDECFSQRATNVSMRDGMGLDFTLPLGAKVHLDFQTMSLLKDVGTYLVPELSLAASVVTVGLSDAYFLELNRLYMNASISAQDIPDGTETANDMGGFLGVGENASFSSTPPAKFADARFADSSGSPLRALPAQPSQRLDEEATSTRLVARVFNKAHVADWCADDETNLAALQARVEQSSAPGVPLIERQGACGVCVEFASRHVQLLDASSPIASVCQLARAQGDPSPAGVVESNDTVGLADVMDRLKITARRTCGCDAPDVLASSASGFSGFDSKVAVNNQGLVAFSATVAATGEISGFVAKEPENFKRVTFAGSATRNFGGAAIMNASEPISAFRERWSGAPATFFIRKWTYAGVSTVVGRSPNNYDSAAFFLDVNDAGLVAFQALVNGSSSTALMAGTNEAVLDTLVSFAGSVAIRPQVSGSNDIVFRKPDGTVTVISYVGSGLPNPQSSIAGPPAYSNVGDRPGISSDGRFVAFTGSTAAGAGIHLANRGVQPAGISTLVDTTGNPASATGQFLSFGLDKRVAVANMAGSNGGRQIRVLFAGQRLRLAEGNAAKDGIYVVDSQLSATGQLTPGLPRKILQVGDVIVIGGADETVSGFDLWDPLSDDGRVTAFWVSFQSGKQAVLRRSL
jgi:hypothetical protein